MDSILLDYQPTLDNIRYGNSWHQYAFNESWSIKIANFTQEQ
jgi:hypothetical protein